MEIQANGNIWRIVNADDLVTQVPPACFKDIKGHRHIDNGIQISKDVSPVPLASERLIDDPNFPPCVDIPQDRYELWLLIQKTKKHRMFVFPSGLFFIAPDTHTIYMAHTNADSENSSYFLL